MTNIYTIEDAKARMQESVNFYKYRIEAWEKVQRLHKKNGEDFAILSKNFENCRFYKEWSHDVLAVYFRCPMPNGGTKCESDTIWLDGNEYAGREPADTADKVEERIAQTVKQYRENLEKDERGLAEIVHTLEALAPILQTIHEVVEKGKENGTNYVIREYLEHNVR